MKKTISLLLVFGLFAFSLFSTGCGSSGGGSSSGGSNIGGFKFHGAVVDIDVVAGLDGATNSARLSPNVRGAIAISARDTIVKVYELDARADGLRGTPISNIAARFDNKDNKLSCNTGDKRLEVGDYLFEVYNSGKVFLRAILHVDGTSNKVSLEISPVTEIKTAVYKEWVAKAPAVTSITNFELNLTDLTPAQKTQMTEKAKTYAENLAIWNKTADIAGTVEVDDIDVPIATKVPVEDDLIASFPVDLQNATWRAIAANDIDGKQFVKRYMFDTDKKWIKFTNEGTDNLPYITFTNEPIGFHGFHKMTISYYSEDTMNGWAPVNNQFEIPEADVSNRITDNDSSNYKVSLGLKIEVNVLADGGKTTKITYDAKITSHNSKTYLHLKNADDEGIYELIPQPNNPIPGTTRPADLKNATWTTITAANIVGKKFGMRYILDTDTNTWIKFTNTDTDKLPNIMLSNSESDLRSGYYYMGGHGYTEETMEGWEPVGNQFEIPQEVYWDEFSSSIYKVLSDSKIEVIDVVNDTLVEEEEFNYDARITVYNGITYLHVRGDMDDQEIYELIPQQPYGSLR